MAGSPSPVESLASISGSVFTPSTKKGVRIFRDELPPIIANSEMSPDFTSLLVDIIFKTFPIYDDGGSRQAVNDVIVKALGEVTFMKSFAAALVQAMEKQSKFQSYVKSVVLSTLSIMIRKGGIALKPFLHQLQMTFIKCLQDNARTVRSSAALALGKLSALSTRVDPLVSDLLSSLQASDSGIREAMLTALKGVVKHAGKNVSPATRIRVYTLLKDLFHHDDDLVGIFSSSILGVISQYMEESLLSEFLQELLGLSSSSNCADRHGAVLTFSALTQFPLLETSTKALGTLLLYQVQSDPSNSVAIVDILSCILSALRDDFSEVRRRALSAVKAVAKANTSVIMTHLSLIGPALAECLKDSSTPVRLAGERCALHSFQLTKGTENVQAAQKYITGLDARRISKFPAHSDDSEDSEDDSANS